MLKHDVEEMIGYKAKSRGLDSGLIGRRPSRTYSQALDLEFGHLSQTVPPKGPLLVSLSKLSPQCESWTPCFCYVVPTLLDYFLSINKYLGNSVPHKVLHFPIEWLWQKKKKVPSQVEKKSTVLCCHFYPQGHKPDLLVHEVLCTFCVFSSGSRILLSLSTTLRCHPLSLGGQVTFFFSPI